VAGASPVAAGGASPVAAGGVSPVAACGLTARACALGVRVYDTEGPAVPTQWPGVSSGLVYAMYRAVATRMNRAIGNAKVSIDAPKFHAPPGKLTADSFSLATMSYRA
jgi:hypothetical protein